MSEPVPQEELPPPQTRSVAVMAAAAEEEAATDEDEDHLLQVIVAVIAAYLMYRAAKALIKRPWREVARLLNIESIAGAAMADVARRAVTRQIGRSAHGRDLAQFADGAIQASVDTQTRLLVDAVRHYEQRNAVVPDAAGEWRDQRPHVYWPTSYNPPKQLAERMAVVGRNTAQMEVELEYGLSRQEDGQVFKTWQSVSDAHVRPSHQFLNWKGYEYHSVPISKPFVTIFDDRLDYPGDPKGRMAEIAGCRCFMTFDFKRVPVSPDASFFPAYWLRQPSGDPLNEQARRDRELRRWQAEHDRREAIYQQLM